jgi:hypothetical protein
MCHYEWIICPGTITGVCTSFTPPSREPKKCDCYDAKYRFCSDKGTNTMIGFNVYEVDHENWTVYKVCDGCKKAEYTWVDDALERYENKAIPHPPEAVMHATMRLVEERAKNATASS